MKFRAIVKANVEIFKMIEESVAIIKDAKFTFEEPKTLQGISFCDFTVDTKIPREALMYLFQNLSKVAEEFGLVFIELPDDVVLSENVTIVLKGSNKKPLDELIDSKDSINVIFPYLKVTVSDIQSIPGDYLMICDVLYDPRGVDKEFIRDYFESCSKAYGISCNVFEGGAAC